jgi:putative membrane-bound dehydrogenase-like protein
MKHLRRYFPACAPALLLASTVAGLPQGTTNPGGVGPAAALESLKNLKTPEGLEVSLFASEPMVRNPADMDIDARGRVWVTEGVNYRLFQRWGKLRPEGDRIVILEDTDGDGVADKEKTFYQGNEVNTALGICVLGDKVIVSCSPNVLIFTDANHDDKADGPPQVLFTGFKGVDHDHGVHAFVFGPDGKLYFNTGNSGQEVHHADGSIVKDVEGNEVVARGKPFRQGMAFRCNPDGSEFEVIGHNFRNNYELCVDSFGTVWQSDNDDDGNRGVRINYVMKYGNYGYTDEMTGAGWDAGWKKAQAKGAKEEERPFYHFHQYDPGVVPNLLQTGNGSPTGILVYEGKLLPEPFRNQVIHCDAGPRVVRAYPVVKDGAGYKATTVDLLAANDNDKWYRPSDVCVAPDGSVYIADWNDAGVGGHFMADQKVETMTGRIYRVAPKGRKPSVPQQNFTTANGCVGALQSPNLATRHLAWTKLHDMQGAAEKDLAKLWRSKDPVFRARALHLLARIKGSEKKYIELALKDSDSDIRITGLRIAQDLKMDMIPHIKSLLKDSSAQVRRECILALHHSASPEAPHLWATLAQQHDGKDRWYVEALGIGADGQWDKCMDAWLAQVGNNTDTAAARDIIWRSRSRKTPALLVRIIKDKNTPAAERDRYFRSLDFVKGPEKDAALLELLTGSAK